MDKFDIDDRKPLTFPSCSAIFKQRAARHAGRLYFDFCQVLLFRYDRSLMSTPLKIIVRYMIVLDIKKGLNFLEKIKSKKETNMSHVITGNHPSL